jgi:glucoamylase
VLRIVVPSPALVHWSFDGWRSNHDTNTRDPLGMYIADLPAADLKAGAEMIFTFYWQNEQRWEGTDFAVTIESE